MQFLHCKLIHLIQLTDLLSCCATLPTLLGKCFTVFYINVLSVLNCEHCIVYATDLSSLYNFNLHFYH